MLGCWLAAAPALNPTRRRRLTTAPASPPGGRGGWCGAAGPTPLASGGGGVDEAAPGRGCRGAEGRGAPRGCPVNLLGSFGPAPESETR
ncbi:hypothetical protein EJB05_34338, partial [Eragrostis curvula]